MKRIGVFIDGMRQLIPATFCERLGLAVRKLPNVVTCSEEENLTSLEALARISREIEKNKLEGIVIAGGSPHFYESSFLKSRLSLPLNPYLVAVANILELALRSSPTEEIALEKAERAIRKALGTLSVSKALGGSSLPLSSEVLVIGGGIVGISVALALSRANISVTILEKENELGGKVRKLWRAYGADGDGDVSKWLERKVQDIRLTPGITVLTGSELKAFKGHIGRFEARIIQRDGSESTFFFSAVVVATGFVSQRNLSGIYGHRAVVGLDTVERLLSESSSRILQWGGRDIGVVTYLLDHIDEGTEIDFIHAVKQSLILKDAHSCEVAILCKELKVSPDGMERLYRKAREKGVLFVRYDRAPRLSLIDGKIQVSVIDAASIREEDRWPISIISDLVVVSEAYVPSPDTEKLSRLLGLRQGKRGFLMDDNPQLLRIRSNRRGIFVAGGCRFPQDLSESLVEAEAVAGEVISLLSKGSYWFDLAVAEVDPEKCAVCYTCVNLCPHSAVKVDRYADKNVYSSFLRNGGTQWASARVDPASCYGCGICVAECPAKAIKLIHQPDDHVRIHMGFV